MKRVPSNPKSLSVKEKPWKPQRAANRTIVVKIGSASLTTEKPDCLLNIRLIAALVDSICKLRRLGFDVILVTSGAVSVGCLRLGLKTRPTTLVTKQACAAVGQSRLMRVYDDVFSHYNQPIAQVLLSRDNLNQKHHYVNAQNTFVELLRMGIVPIVNENDTVAVEELRVGDNDTLSALVASLIGAEYLVLLTDVDALYTKDPSKHPDAKPIHRVDNLDDIKAEIGDGGAWGTGGMFTKIQAARIAKAAGVKTVICHSCSPDVIIRICAEGSEDIGTVFTASEQQIEGKKKWLAHGLTTVGVLQIDDGCRKALLKKSSLFAAGIVKVEGEFASKSNVRIIDQHGQEIARGLVEYSSQEIDLIKGQTSKAIAQLLGYFGAAEVIHRANLVVTSAAHASPFKGPEAAPVN